jgi:ribosomal protein S27AE
MINNNEQYDYVIDNGNVIDITKKTWNCPRCGNPVSSRVLICPYCGASRTDEDINANEQMICG